MDNILVSIIIPVYNRQDLLGETLNSVLMQTHEYWECIIVDDGSEDNSRRLAEEYTKNDKRFKLLERPGNLPKGASTCRNIGLQNARGELIQFLDSDDLLAYNKIKEQLKLYDTGKLELLTCRWGGFTDPKDLSTRFKYKYQSYRNFPKGIRLLNTFGLFNEYFPLHVYLTPKKVIEKAGFWNEELTNNDDAEFFTRVILNASRIKFVPEAEVYYRYNSEDKLSEIDTPEKIDSLSKSIDLISKEIADSDKKNKVYYAKRLKNNLHDMIIKSDINYYDEVAVLKKERENFDSLLYTVRKKLIQYLH